MNLKYFNEINLEKSVLNEECLQNKINAITQDNVVKNFPEKQPSIE